MAASSAPTTRGATWKRVSEDRKLRQRAFYYSRIYADPKTKDTLYVLNTAFFKSVDGGKTFKPIRVPHGDNHDLWIAPNDPKRMIESNDGGGNVSINGGETWTGQAYPTAQLYHVATTRRHSLSCVRRATGQHHHLRFERTARARASRWKP